MTAMRILIQSICLCNIRTIRRDLFGYLSVQKTHFTVKNMTDHTGLRRRGLSKAECGAPSLQPMVEASSPSGGKVQSMTRGNQKEIHFSWKIAMGLRVHASLVRCNI
jgi:hypothetical protein